MIAQVGTARATLMLTPDPPSTGPVHASIVVEGASPDALAKTDVRFASMMPAMSMSGPAGAAHRTGPDIAIAAGGKTGTVHVTQDVK